MDCRVGAWCRALLVILGVATITTSRVSAFVERLVISSFSCFICLVSRYKMSGVPLSGLVVTPNVPALMRLTLWGLLPRHGGLIVRDGSVLYSSLDKEDI